MTLTDTRGVEAWRGSGAYAWKILPSGGVMHEMDGRKNTKTCRFGKSRPCFFSGRCRLESKTSITPVASCSQRY